MKTQDIFNLAINLGIEADPRGRDGVEKYLKRLNKKFLELNSNEKEFFDKQRLTNPYMDSQIHFDNGKDVKKILVGIDIGTAEVLLADKLEIDLIISHHPEGNALAQLDDVMLLQADLLHKSVGIPINIAESITKKRTAELKRKLSPLNHHQAIDSAKILNISFISLHTPCDNLVWYYLEQALSGSNPDYVSDVLELLNKIPEYQEGKKRGAGPMLFVGNPDNRVGKLACTDITGGTSNDKIIYEKLAQAGLGTIVGMHMGEDSREVAENNHINVIIAGHMSSDSLGLNIFIDEIDNKEIKITPCSGFIRIKRK